ncbi:hypothetical protein AB0J80_32375 [Actinoplanes sp. NPDC049548]|uniref:hypothetical protein n=1 Tax=Actinoplanes sp. NPDC049548 TaxID=3155152 RepID=UPI003413947F
MVELTRREKQIIGCMALVCLVSGTSAVVLGAVDEREGVPATRDRTVVAGAEEALGSAARPGGAAPTRTAAPGLPAPQTGAPSRIRTLTPWTPAANVVAGTAAVAAATAAATAGATTGPAPAPVTAAPQDTTAAPRPPVVMQPPVPTPTRATTRPAPHRPTTPAATTPATHEPTTPATTPAADPATTPATDPATTPATTPATEEPAPPAEPEPAKSEPQGADGGQDFPWEPGAGGLPGPDSVSWPPAMPDGNPFG